MSIALTAKDIANKITYAHSLTTFNFREFSALKLVTVPVYVHFRDIAKPAGYTNIMKRDFSKIL